MCHLGDILWPACGLLALCVGPSLCLLGELVQLAHNILANMLQGYCGVGSTWPSLSNLVAILWPCWGLLVPLCCLLGSYWSYPWDHIGPSWCHLRVRMHTNKHIDFHVAPQSQGLAECAKRLNNQIQNDVACKHDPPGGADPGTSNGMRLRM